MIEEPQTPNAPDVICENTGIVMSPIRKPVSGINMTNDNSNTEEAFDNPDIVIHELNEETDNGLSNCYNTEDIIEVLESSREYSESDYVYEADQANAEKVRNIQPENMCVENGIKHVEDKGEWTGDEYVDYLDKTEDGPSRDNLKTDRMSSASSPVDKNEYCKGKLESDNKSEKAEVEAIKERKPFLLRSPLKHELDNKSLTNIEATCVDNIGTVRKSYSLPYRSKPRVRSDLENKRGGNHHDISTNTVQTPGGIVSHIPWIPSTNVDRPASAQSQSTHPALFVCDVEEYTLTTSEAETESGKDDVRTNANNSDGIPNIDTVSEQEWELSAHNDINLQNSGSFRTQSRKQPLRSDSFLEAVSGERGMGRVESETLSLNIRTVEGLEDTDIEEQYLNYGYELDECEGKDVTKELNDLQEDDCGDLTVAEQSAHGTVDVVVYF